MTSRRVIPVLSVLVALAAIGTGAWITWRRAHHRPLSDTITMVPEGAHPRHQVLLPKLERRTVVIPDRPANPGEGYTPGSPLPDNISRRRTFHISTNSIGLRGPEVEVPAPRTRVICAGDSITFGWGVAYEEGWPHLLGQELGWDAVAAAWPGADPMDLADWIVAHARELDADVVLFTWGPGSGGPTLERYVERLREVAETLAPVRLGWVLPPTGTFDPRGSRNAETLYPQVPGMIPSVPVLDLTPAFRAALPLPGVVGDVAGSRQRMIRHPGGAVLLDVPAPPLDPRFGQLLSPAILAAFEGDHALREPLFFDEGHPDAEGFRLFAREVAAWLRALGWVPEAGQGPAGPPAAG